MKQWLFLLLFLVFFQNTALAASMENDVFQLDFTEGITTPTQAVKKPTSQVASQANKPQTLLISSPFSFSASASFIDYGEFVPTELVVRTLLLTIDSTWPYGFFVLGSENHDLRSQTASIPDTSCDNGSCTPTLSAPWTSLLTYGFGFSCETPYKVLCLPYKIPSTGYRPFANLQKNISPQTILLTPQSSSKAHATLQLKVNTSKSQPQEIYQNNLEFMAVPKL